MFLLVACGSVVDKRDNSNTTIDINSNCYVGLSSKITYDELLAIEESENIDILKTEELDNGRWNVTTCTYDLSEQDNDTMVVPK